MSSIAAAWNGKGGACKAQQAACVVGHGAVSDMQGRDAEDGWGGGGGGVGWGVGVWAAGS